MTTGPSFWHETKRRNLGPKGSPPSQGRDVEGAWFGASQTSIQILASRTASQEASGEPPCLYASVCASGRCVNGALLEALLVDESRRLVQGPEHKVWLRVTPQMVVPPPQLLRLQMHVRLCKAGPRQGSEPRLQRDPGRSQRGHSLAA